MFSGKLVWLATDDSLFHVGRSVILVKPLDLNVQIKK